MIRTYLYISILVVLILKANGQIGFDNRNWIIGRYYGDVTRIIPSMGYTVTYFGGLDFTKMPSDTSHLFTQDSTFWQSYWNGTDALSSVLYVENDSSIRYSNVIYGQLYSNDSVHLDLYSGGSVPYSYHFRMKRVKRYWGGCGIVNQSSVLLCNSTYTTVNFTVDPIAALPLSFTVQTPSGCSTGSYVSSSSSANPVFILYCGGTYTFVVRDANNSLLGNFTHTVTESTMIDPGISCNSSIICTGQTMTLNIVGNPGYTISPVNWSEGSTSSSIIVSPTVTTTYSFTGLYTTSSSRTCTAQSSKTIVVNACIGINELEALQNITVSPNPANDKLFIQNPMNIEMKRVSLQSVEGKEILMLDNKYEINISTLSEGIYFLKLETDKGFLTKRIIIQH